MTTRRSLSIQWSRGSVQRISLMKPTPGRPLWRSSTGSTTPTRTTAPLLEEKININCIYFLSCPPLDGYMERWTRPFLRRHPHLNMAFFWPNTFTAILTTSMLFVTIPVLLLFLHNSSTLPVKCVTAVNLSACLVVAMHATFGNVPFFSPCCTP